MRNALVLPALLGGTVFLVLPTSASAEIVVAESIEWVLATSERVVVGKVVQVDTVAGPDQKGYDAVTVAISRTLKGVHADRETVLLPHYLSGLYAKQWVEEGIPMVLCLVKSDGQRLPVPADKYPWVLRDNGNLPDAILLGKSKHYWTGCIPVLTRAFDVLVDKEAILRHVEQVVKAPVTDRAPRSHLLGVPADTAVYKLLWSRSVVQLIVPVDETLERLGQQWCQSAAPQERSEGAYILRHFKSEKNVALLKALLGDASTAEATLHRTVPGKIELELVYRKKVYYVRQAAWEALQELGVKMDRPVLEVLLEGRDEPDGKLDGRKPER